MGVENVNGVEFDMDAAIAEAEQVGGGDMPPGEAPPAQQQPAPPAPAQAAPATPAEPAVDWQARFSELQGQFQTEQQRATQAAEQLKSLERFREYQTFAEQNPGWLEHLNQTWQQRQELTQAQLDPSDPVHARLIAAEQQLAKILPVVENQAQEIASAKIKTENETYLSELSGFQQKYPGIKLDEADPKTGKTKEFQALEYAKTHRIEHLPMDQILTLALHSEIVARTEEGARAKLGQQRQQDHRAGVIQTQAKPDPIDPNSLPKVRGSYRDIEEGVISGLGLK